MEIENSGESNPPIVDPQLRALSIAMSAQKSKYLGDFIEEALKDATERAQVGTFKRLGHRLTTFFFSKSEVVGEK